MTMMGAGAESWAKKSDWLVEAKSRLPQAHIQIQSQAGLMGPLHDGGNRPTMIETETRTTA